MSNETKPAIDNAEALKFLATQAEKAMMPQKLLIAGEPANQTTYYFKDVGVKTTLASSPSPRIVVHKISDLVNCMSMMSRAEPAIFFNLDGIQYVPKIFDPIMDITCYFKKTKAWYLAEGLLLNPSLSVADMRHALQTTLDACKNSADMRVLIDRVSKLGIQTTANASIQIGKTKESMGRSINQAVEQPDELPDEYQTFSIPIHDESDIPAAHPVTFLLLPDIQNQKWRFEPIESSMRQAKENQLAIIRAMLNELVAREFGSDHKINIVHGQFMPIVDTQPKED
ncbi:MAG: hypothetical protein IT440_11065 [Phycisphaeraceae bacterium]|nr:hypothetical protein [Phycisphaeraceae bacterium]